MAVDATISKWKKKITELELELFMLRLGSLDPRVGLDTEENWRLAEEENKLLRRQMMCLINLHINFRNQSSSSLKNCITLHKLFEGELKTVMEELLDVWYDLCNVTGVHSITEETYRQAGENIKQEYELWEKVGQKLESSQ